MWEVTPVMLNDDGEYEAYVTDEEATSFGLYYRGEDGLARWVADFGTRKQAEVVADLLTKHNGRPV